MKEELDASPAAIPSLDEIRISLVRNRRERVFLQRLMKVAELLRLKPTADAAVQPQVGPGDAHTQNGA